MVGGVNDGIIASEFIFFLAFLIELWNSKQILFFLMTMPLTTPPTIGNILGFDLMIPAII